MEATPVVTCPACGGASRDSACCEFCNANLTPDSPPPAPTTCPIAPEGPFFLSAKQAGLLTRPEASVTVITPDKSWRLHWISSDLWPEWKPRVEERLKRQGAGARSQEFRAQASPVALAPGESAVRSQVSEIKGQESEVRPADQRAPTPDSRPLTPDPSLSDPCLQTPDPFLPTLPSCRIVEDLTGTWVVAESTGRRPEPWRGPVSEDPLERLRHLAGVAGRGPGFWDEKPAERLGQMVEFLERLADSMECLHHAGLVWLGFHPNAIEESADGLRATNMDLAVYPFASLAYKPRIVPAWAPPEVVRDPASEIGPRTDVYHLALFTYFWLGRLLPNGFPGKGLASFDFEMPPLRILAPTLPAGLAGVVMSGLAVEPMRRLESPRAFCAELRAAVEAIRKREDRVSKIEIRELLDSLSARKAAESQSSLMPSRLGARSDAINPPSSILDPQSSSGGRPWDIGSHTRTGRAKECKGGVNQDSVLTRQYIQPERALLVVADGLSCCDVGSGDVASRLVCEAIDSSFGPDSHANDFTKKIPEACRRGAEAMLAWALDHGERLRLKAAQDLMSTTVLAAWLEYHPDRGGGPELILANAGDSRAYLINEQGIEQLTVDADLGCTLLAAGSPPENVIELGPVTRALRACVGGVLYKSATDELVVDEARLRLVVNRWKLIPGETVILCSDGLVEEGAFLEPAELLELVRCNADLSADALAFALAEAADARQTLPSQEEPDGCGDNIACCVIRLSAG